MSEEIKRKRGRPKSGLSVKQYRLVLSENDFDELSRFCRITGESKADFIRVAIDHRMKEIESERAAKFSHLSRNHDEEDYFDEFYDDFDDEF